MPMKKILLITFFAIASLNMLAQTSLITRLGWIPVTTTYPCYDSKIFPEDQLKFYERVGFNPEDYGNIPIYTWDNVQGTKYTPGANEGAVLYRKFIPTNNNYIVAPIVIGDSDWIREILITFTNSGQVIDYLEVGYGFDLMMYKQWKINGDMKVTVYNLKYTNPTPLPLEAEFTQLTMQRIDTEYQIDTTGHFVKLSEKKYEPKSYTYAYLNDKTKDIWNGNETPLP